MRTVCCALALLAGCDGFARLGIVDDDAGVALAVDASRPTADDGGTPGSGGPGAGARVDGCGPDNAAGLTEAQIVALRSASTIEPGQRYLYPYEGTVFPAGMVAPVVMWEGPDADGVLLELHTGTFDYTGCLRPEARGRITIPQAAWDALGRASGGSADPVRMRISVLAAGRALGPLERSVVVAPDATQATLYYMSYGALGVPSLFRLAAKGAAEPLFTGVASVGCAGCHGVNVDGSRLLANAMGSGAAYDLGNPGSAPSVLGTQRTGAEYAALHPGGAFYVATAHPNGGAGTRSFSLAAQDAGLYDVLTGALIAGANIPRGALVPAFSPSGARLAFNDFAIDQGRGLAIMDFDAATASARGYRELYRDASAYPGWPSFTPDEARLVFALGQRLDFASGGAGFATGVAGVSPSDLYVIDVGTGEHQLLARIAGFSQAGQADAQTYLPVATDLHRNYDPSVSPVASSEYAWVYFDSYRSYGNQGVARQLWAAAVDLRAGPGDPSHPPFWVPGQDLASTNLRPAAVRR